MPANLYGLMLRRLRGLVAPGGDDALLLARFAHEGDEAAFASLVRRHGPMVLALCRRWLGHEQDAEDVLQATFLVLARKAGAVRRGEALASFLHGVALRLARKVWTETVHRRQVRADNPRKETPDPLAQLSVRELRQVVDEEVGRLPERYRAPVLLCWLQGQTQDEAARVLGWSKATVRRRLARARGLLRARLRGRGLAPVLGTSLLAGGSTAPAPAALVEAAVRSAFSAGALRGTVAALAEAGVQAPTRLRVTAALLLAAGVLAVAGGVAAHRAGSPLTGSVPKAKGSPTVQATPRWDEPLPEGAVALLGTRRGRSPSVHSLCFTEDGKGLVSVGWGPDIRLWDPETCRPVRKLSAPPSVTFLDSLSLAGDRRTLAVRTRSLQKFIGNYTAEVWDLPPESTPARSPRITWGRWPWRPTASCWPFGR